MLLEFSIKTGANIAYIPRNHRISAIIIALRMASVIDMSGYYQLRFEFISLAYDHYDIVEGVIEDDLSIDYKLFEWYRRLIKAQAGDIREDAQHPRAHYTHMQRMFHATQTTRQFFKDRNAIEPQTMKAYVESRLSQLHATAKRAEQLGPHTPRSIVDTSVIGIGLELLWYHRDRPTLQQIVPILKQFEPLCSRRLIDNSIQYLETLINTKEATYVEIELFGKKPAVWLPWHSHMCLQYIVRQSV